MIRLSFSRLALFSATLFVASVAAAQAPPAAGAPAGQQPPRTHPAPTNVKALPKTISGDDLNKLMRQYTGDLGVGCDFCHAQDPTTKRNNFASDANPIKDVARYMITMTADLNDKYLAQMPDRRYADPITCGTCHRGEKHPSVFVPAPPAARPAPPPPPAPSH